MNCTNFYKSMFMIKRFPILKKAKYFEPNIKLANV